MHCGWRQRPLDPPNRLRGLCRFSAEWAQRRLVNETRYTHAYRGPGERGGYRGLSWGRILPQAGPGNDGKPLVFCFALCRLTQALIQLSFRA